MAPSVADEVGAEVEQGVSHVLVHVVNQDEAQGGQLSTRASLDHPPIMRHSNNFYVSAGGATFTGAAAVDAEREARERELREQRRVLVRARWSQAISKAVKVRFNWALWGLMGLQAESLVATSALRLRTARLII